MGGVRIPYENDTISNIDIANFGTELLDDSDSLAAESRWQVGLAHAGTAVECLSDEFTTSLLNIEKVNARCLDSYQYLSRSGS